MGPVRFHLRDSQTGPMDQICRRAALWGLDTEYRDAFGNIQIVQPTVLARLLDLLPEDPPKNGPLPASVIVREGSGSEKRLGASGGFPLRWTVLAEHNPIASGVGAFSSLSLPNHVPPGTFQLAVKHAGKPDEDKTCLIVCPGRAYQGQSDTPRRMWALAVQLYAIRSQRNCGHGDFGDLEQLIDLAAELGAAGIALNPLHALFDDHADGASPYSPSSRLFLNPLYVALANVPEFGGPQAASVNETFDEFRERSILDYRELAAAKARALGLAYRNFLETGSLSRRQSFDAFREQGGKLLGAFASFEFLRRRFNAPWWEWPREWRKPDPDALADLRAREELDICYYEFIQWLADEQLDRCRAKAADRGLSIGLYLDMAVGVRNDGFDAWYDQASFLQCMTIGAPPDILNPAGQTWGLASFNPHMLEQNCFEPFRRML